MRGTIASAGLLLAFAANLATAAEGPDGKAVYRVACAACHDSGAGRAPKLGDSNAWLPRFNRGIDGLYRSSIAGRGTMPAKGGRASLTTAEVEAAVNYMVLQVDASPASPAVAATAGTPARSVPSPAARDPAPASASAGKGQSVYAASCAACHASGAAGAPKVGDVPAWAPKLKAGIPALQASALSGKGAMPPKGGNAALSDADVRAAVGYMAEQSGGPRASGEGTPSLATAAKPAAPAALPSKLPATAAAAVPASAPQPSSAMPPAAPPGQSATVVAAASPNAFNRLLRAPGRRNAPPPEDGIHDPTNEETFVLQAPLAAFSALPRSNSGNRVDWGKALAEGKIAPRHDRLDPKALPALMDLNIVREVKGSMPDVVYPHKQHTQWLDCSNCHPAIFKPQKGANQISMASILLGEACGVCHGKVAFPVSECRLCHSKSKAPATASTSAKREAR